jgi:hypothetical protein
VNPLLDPVGPLERGVYWRRRAVLLGVLFVLLLVLVRACDAAGGGGDTGAVASSGTPTTSSSASPSGTSSGTSKATSTASATSSPRSTSSSTAAVASCADADVVVTARPAKQDYAVGDTVNITFVVGTKGDTPCKRDVGGLANEVRVNSGANSIWSSDRCSPGGEKDVRTIGPNDAYTVIVEWDGTVAAGGCPEERLPAPAGVYQVVGRNGDVLSAASTLNLG